MLFAATAILYSGLWIVSAMRGVPVELGFDNKYIPNERCQLIQSVVRNSPAERAGMKTGIALSGSTVLCWRGKTRSRVSGFSTSLEMRLS